MSDRYGSVAQLVRALACHARGREFEPRRSRHFKRRCLHLLFYVKETAEARTYFEFERGASRVRSAFDKE